MMNKEQAWEEFLVRRGWVTIDLAKETGVGESSPCQEHISFDAGFEAGWQSRRKRDAEIAKCHGFTERHLHPYDVCVDIAAAIERED